MGELVTPDYFYARRFFVRGSVPKLVNSVVSRNSLNEREELNLFAKTTFSKEIARRRILCFVKN